jgi:hypothetical protein
MNCERSSTFYFYAKIREGCRSSKHTTPISHSRRSVGVQPTTYNNTIDVNYSSADQLDTAIGPQNTPPQAADIRYPIKEVSLSKR